MCYATNNTSGIVVVSPTKNSQNILLFFGLKPLQTDLVNIVWLINLGSLISVILTVLDSWCYFSSMRHHSKH
jgi:hypothetical protein